MILRTVLLGACLSCVGLLAVTGRPQWSWLAALAGGAAGTTFVLRKWLSGRSG